MATQRSISVTPRTRPATKAVSGRRPTWQLLTLGLLVADAAALAVAFALSYLIRFKAGLPLLETPAHDLSFYSTVAFASIPAWLAIFGLFRLYDRHHLFAGFGEYVRIVNAVTCGIMATIAISFLDQALFISRGWLGLVFVLSICTVGAQRFSVRRALRALRLHGYFVSRTLIVGANDEGRALADQFGKEPACGFQVVGFVDNARPVGSTVQGDLQVVGRLGNLQDVVHSWEATEVVVAMTAVRRDELLELYRSLGNATDVEIRLSSGLYEVLTTGVRVQEVAYVPLVTPQRTRITGVDAFLKATLDYVGAILGLIAFAPVWAIISVLVKLDSPGPVFHRRIVLGRSGKPFGAFKFRTMVVNADEMLNRDPELREAFAKGYKLQSDPRVTRLGRFLRKTSLDEFPQLLNVLRGEMSLVGPRMIAPDEAVRYGQWRLNLLTVKPGITGPWQVQGRSDIPYEERVRLSTNYIRNYTIWADLEILLRTVPAVLKSRGAY